MDPSSASFLLPLRSPRGLCSHTHSPVTAAGQPHAQGLDQRWGPDPPPPVGALHPVGADTVLLEPPARGVAVRERTGWRPGLAQREGAAGACAQPRPRRRPSRGSCAQMQPRSLGRVRPANQFSTSVAAETTGTLLCESAEGGGGHGGGWRGSRRRAVGVTADGGGGHGAEDAPVPGPWCIPSAVASPST